MVIGHKNRDKNSSAYQHIFLLSHMRANTSLISHILGSHPQIYGYYELHLSYRTDSDLQTQEQLLLANKDIDKEKYYTGCQYLLDKILHNDYELLLNELESNSIKILVSIRPAEQSIKSIINLFGNKRNKHPYADPETATEYYLERIKELVNFCQHNTNKYYYYDADLIRVNPQKSLSRIQSWLSLSTPLSEQYQIFSLTGKARVGDSSDNMTKGEIIKHQTNYDAIEIPSQLLQKAVTESEKYRQVIINHAIDSITL